MGWHNRPGAYGLGRSVSRLLTAALLGMLLPAGLVAAQTGQAGRSTAAKASGPRDAVWLIVRPRVGDTLHLQMEQSVEIDARSREGPRRGGPPLIDPRRTPAAPSGPEYGPRRAKANSRVTRLTMYAHSLVEASDLTSTTLLATTDSMSAWAGSARDSGTVESVPLPAEGRQVRVRVTPDGAMRINDPPPGAMELGATLASMQGMLPERAVAVGDRWERDLVLPSVAVGGNRADGVVHARFRLDSLVHGGRDAWISMEGTLERDGAAREMPAGTRVITAGTMSGTLVVDRQRAWIVDARTTLDVQSEVVNGPAGPAAPMVLDMRILQRMRVR